MNNHEEELQKNIEAGKIKHTDGSDNIKAYQYVFKGLRKEPDFQLPSSFADKVVSVLTEKQKTSAAVSEYIWTGVGFFFLLVSAIVTIALTGFNLDFGFLEGLSPYKGVLLFGICFVLLFQWLDKRLVKKMIESTNA